MSQHQQQFTAEEKSVYGSLFKSIDKEGLGIVTGEVARPIFEKSGLSTSLLRDIWQLADTEGNGFLTEFAFFASLRLIGHCQHGAIPSSELINISGPIANLSPAAPKALNSQVPGTPVSRQASSQAVFPPLTNQDVAKFGLLFQRTAPNGVLNGDQAKAIFLKANLPTPTLGQIWNLVDREQSGRLSQQEFVMAMYLIQNTINGSLKQIPQFIPQAIWSIADSASALGPLSPKAPNRTPSIQRKPSQNSLTSLNQEWTISAAQKQQFDSIFDSLDKNKTGILTPNEVAQFLMTSNLPQDTLGAIWDLADVDNSGEFTKREFSIALYLVNRRLAGGDLPNIVPDRLIVSALQKSSVPSLSPPPTNTTTAPPNYRSQSSINDLASLNDLFSSPVATPTIATALAPAAFVKPQLTSSLTGTRAPFVPSSSFGQNMQSLQLKAEPPSLLEESGEESDDDEGPISAEPIRTSQRPVIPAREQKPQFTGESNPPSNYAAFSNISSDTSSAFTSQPVQQRLFTGNLTQVHSEQRAAPQNNDLLADSEVSGQLSLATTDIANISNQINSLTNQTTQLNQKRERADGELTRILLLKKDIESKLTKLRALYEQEVAQVQEVESVLLQSKQETENLQKEASLTEANYHATQAKLQQLQVQYESSQKEIETLKEKLGAVNAENIELTNQHEQLIAQQKQAASLLSVTQQQVNVLESKNAALRSELEQTNRDVSSVEEEHENAKSKLDSLKAEIPMLTAAISAAAATVAMTKSLLKNTTSSIQYHSQQKKELEEKHLLIQQQQKAPEEPQPMFTSGPEPEGTNFSAITPITEGEGSAKPQERNIEGESESALESTASNTGAPSSEKTATETPVSSPAGSDFQYAQQYQNFNLPLGRPHSASSSVLNNPPLSVRGEENVSEPGTSSSIEEEIATPTGTISNQLHPHAEQTSQDFVHQSDGEAIGTSQTSSTGESFEIVEAENDDAHTIQRKDTNEQLGDSLSQVDEPSSSSVTIKPAEETAEPASTPVNRENSESITANDGTSGLSAIPGAFVSAPPPVDLDATEGSSKEVKPSNIEEEFPPIKELDYDESDSSSDDEGPKEQFDDALDNLPETKKTDFDEFDDLQPAVVEDGQPPHGDDLFDEFAGLEEALPEESQVPGFEDDENGAFNQGFTDSTAQNDLFNSFGTLEPSTTEANNDEWEQLFEGFGNSNTANFEKSLPSNTVGNKQVFPVVGSHQDSHAHELAIQELTGMGFSEQAVIEALNKEDWNLENATNHLLDQA